MCSSVLPRSYHSLPTPLAPQGSFRERRERNGTEERVGRDTKGTKEPQYWKSLKYWGFFGLIIISISCLLSLPWLSRAVTLDFLGLAVNPRNPAVRRFGSPHVISARFLRMSFTPFTRRSRSGGRKWTGVNGMLTSGKNREPKRAAYSTALTSVPWSSCSVHRVSFPPSLRPPSHSIRLRHVVESERSEHGTEWPEVNETRGQQNQGSKIDRRDGFSVFLPSRPHSAPPHYVRPAKRRLRRWVVSEEPKGGQNVVRW